MKKITVFPVFLIILVSCQTKNAPVHREDMAGYDEAVMPATMRAKGPEAPPPVAEQVSQPGVNKKKIIKDGRMGLKVDELENTKTLVDSLLKGNGGYYAKENFQNTDNESTYYLTVRIPAGNFEQFIASVESGRGEILYKEIDARDVTDQFIDLETRLENKRAYLKRYNELLKQARNVKEILDIEEKIRILEEEIESTTGRLKYLGDQVDYSTLELMITREKDFTFKPVKRGNFAERLKQSLSRGWYGFIDFLLFIIKIWTFWIISGIVVYFWKRNRKKNKK